MIIVQWLRRVWYLLNRSRFERDLQQEMLAHRELMGDPVRFGNTLRLGEQARDAWGWNWLDALWRDVRYGLRGLQREPTFALAAILTLALGVATTTTVFSVVDAELWKPLPLPHPEQLVAVYSRGPGENGMVDAISGADLLQWRAAADAFSDLAAVGGTSRQVLRLDTAYSVLVAEVTANYFVTLGREGIAGTLPVGGEHHAVTPLVLTDRAWTRLFTGDPSSIGRKVVLNGETAVVLGVVRADESLGPDPDVYVVLDEQAPSFADRSGPTFWTAIGRLRPGMDPAVARAQLQSVETRMTPSGSGSRASHTVNIQDLRRYYFTGNNWRPLYFFLGASMIVLLLSVVNVATLLLARAIRRSREFALRSALGGGRPALTRHLLVEAGLVALSGAALGGAATTVVVGVVAAQLPADFLLRGSSISVDYRVFVFALTITVAIALGFALAPLALLRRMDLSRTLGAGARSGISATEGRMRGVLLTAQIALTLVLLSGAGLFLKSFSALTHAPLGFDPRNALVVHASLGGPRYATDTAVLGYAKRLLDSAHSTPGVRLAAIASSSPLGSGPLVQFAAAEQATSATDARRAILRAVSAGYFETLDIRMLQGREFSASDSAGAPRVAIVNESLARQLFGDTPAVGRALELLPGARVPWTQRPGPVVIVGVAANVKEVAVNEVEFPDIYLPFNQAPAPWVELIAHVDGSVASVGAMLSNNAARLDPGMPVNAPVPFERRLAGALQGDRFNTWLVSGFAGVALILAAVGIYGGVAYNVQAHTRELGVRLALGAQPSRLVGVALWQAARLGIMGSTIGLAGALALALVIGDALYLVPGSHNALLYGVTTTDPSMLAMAFAGILVVAVAAAAIPARRVAKVDPVAALRVE
jgi:putative ABC transport system permease protein